MSITRARSALPFFCLAALCWALPGARAAEQGVEMCSHLGVGALHVLGDADQLKQVFLNLLINSLQSMPSGGRITVGAAPWPGNEPGGHAGLHSVRADGCGGGGGGRTTRPGRPQPKD